MPRRLSLAAVSRVRTASLIAFPFLGAVLFAHVGAAASGQHHASTTGASVTIHVSVRGQDTDAARVLLYRVRTGGRAVSLRLLQRPPRWPEPWVFGSPIALRRPRLIGAGDISVSDSDVHYVEGVCVRGADATEHVMYLDLPGGAAVTVVQPIRFQPPLWRGGAITPSASWNLLGSRTTHHIHVPVLRTRRLSGVHVVLSTEPRLSQRLNGPYGPYVPTGQPIRIRGYTVPQLRHRRLRLTSIPYNATDLVNRGSVTQLPDVITGSRGRFHTVQRVPAAGGHEIIVRTGSSIHGSRAGSNCDLHFIVGAAPRRDPQVRTRH